MFPSKMHAYFCKLLNAMIIGKMFDGVNVYATSLLADLIIRVLTP